MRDYTKIEAWRLADDLAVKVYDHTKGFPREETFGITRQIRDAASSVPANIAEGSARESRKEYLHFLYIARGSLTETQYFVHLASRLGYLSEGTYEDLSSDIKSTFARLHGLIRAVQTDSSPLGNGQKGPRDRSL
jgi:four helix bundle protein